MQVTKRDGQLTNFDVSKIKKVVSSACEGFDINPLELEASFNKLFFDGVTTRDIQRVLIVEAAARTSLDEPDWRYVAGRLHIMNQWKDAAVKRGIPKYGDKGYQFSQVVGFQVDNNRYDDAIYFHYSSEELDKYGQLIKAEYDLDLDYAASVAYAKRYLVENELPQEALLMAALWIATRENPENRPLYIEKFYRAFAERRISLATPILINLRRPNVNLSSCFILSASDSMQSIINAITDVGTISQSGGGVGVNISHVSAVAQKNTQILSEEDYCRLDVIEIQDSLASIMNNATNIVAAHFKQQKSVTFSLSQVRAKGSSIQNVPGIGGGVIPWVMIIDTFANSVTKSRNERPGLNVILHDWHLDIEDFLALGNRTGDQRRRVRYATPKVVVSEKLRLAAQQGQNWVLADPHEVQQGDEDIINELYAEGELKNCKVVNAKDLLEKIESAFEQPGQHPSINRWAQAINSVAVGVNQLGKRSGAVTISLDTWHLGIEEFIEIQSEKGDATEKAFDIFPQVVCSDWFMRAAKSDEPWLLVDPAEVLCKFGIDLPKLWGEEFDSAYQTIWDNRDQLTHHKVVNAKQLYIQIMRAEVETGMPYQTFKDTINRANPNKYEGYIPASNLCLAPETRVLTKNGQLEIGSLEGQYVSVWNGQEWSEVLVKKTGENQELLQVRLSNKVKLDCTPYHHFYRYNKGYRSDISVKALAKRVERVEAKDLKPGDELIKFDLPVLDGGKDFPYAYTHGFFCGDGTYIQEDPYLYLYGEKRELLRFIEVRNKRKAGFHGVKDLGEKAICVQDKHNRIKTILPDELAPKYQVPLGDYSIQSRLEWLAGLTDSDGCAKTSKMGLSSIEISSSRLEFLQDVRLMIQTLGIDTRIGLCREGGPRNFPGAAVYSTKPNYTIYIAPSDLCKLSELGFKTNRLKWTPLQPSRICKQLVKVEAVEQTGRISDTFCFTEPKRNMGMFNGILTGQCVESFSNVKPDEESHVCNLVSLNEANLTLENLEEACRLAVRILDNAIDLTTPPTETTRVHNQKYRTIGVGQMGLADFFAKNEVRYGSEESVTLASRLSEDIAYFCFDESANMAAERGTFEAYPSSEWAKGKILCQNLAWFDENAYSVERWYKLAQKIQKSGIRNSQLLAIAPNTSSSLIQGCTASILPVYSRLFYDKGSNGSLPICPPFIKDKFWFYSEAKTVDPNKVIAVTAALQKWTDTGISMELMFDMNNPEHTPKFMFNTMMNAWESGCKTIYYIRSVQRAAEQEEDTCLVCKN